MSSTIHRILATAGHVDHGKSSLVKALTGIDPDRLPEEKARGITIELGFAHLTLPGVRPGQAAYQLGIVDVPGHEDFVKNMVTGVGSIDLALLVVAADDGWMPQTEEHLQILDYLDIRSGVVALTKIDLVTADIKATADSTRSKLSGSVLANAPIIPCSGLTGDGMTELTAALREQLNHMPPPRDLQKPRLAIDRAFTLRGIGTVVTGTLVGGELQRGQSVVLQPSGQASRIRSIQSHNHDVSKAGPGTRVALSLADVSLSTSEAAGVQRGQVVTLPGLGEPADTWDVRLERSSRLSSSGVRGASPLQDGLRVRIHHGTANVGARLLLLKSQELTPGSTALAQVRLERPLFGFIGDRFIVRNWSEQETLAGGFILEIAASRRRFRQAPQRQFLQQRSNAPENAAAFVQTSLDRDHRARSSRLLNGAKFSAEELTAALSQLRALGKVTVREDLLLEASWWNTLRQKAAQLIDQHHQKQPQESGIPLTQLRAALESDCGEPELFDALLADLAEFGFVRETSSVRRRTHRPGLPPQLQAAGAKLRSDLARQPLDPPGRKELAPTPPLQQALRFLIQGGEAVELGADLVLSASAYSNAVELVRNCLRARGPATVSEIRQMLGASRRIVVPLLEKLDRDGVTRRQGDLRVLKS